MPVWEADGAVILVPHESPGEDEAPVPEKGWRPEEVSGFPVEVVHDVGIAAGAEAGVPLAAGPILATQVGAGDEEPVALPDHPGVAVTGTAPGSWCGAELDRFERLV